MRLFCLSNGHGEDEIAVRVLAALQKLSRLESSGPESSWEIWALPLVGEGHPYTRMGVPLLGKVQAMPSGGFVYMDSRQLLRDVRGGLLQLTWTQLQTIRQAAQDGGLVLAIGDIVPLLFAYWSGLPYVFIGTAKSEYHLRDETGPLPNLSWSESLAARWGGIYWPWERWLMQHPRCQAVFPRDRLTAKTLQNQGIRAFDLGNPMMDGLDPATYDSSETEAEPPLTVLLLPGSRSPEAFHNWDQLLAAVSCIQQAWGDRPLRFLAAIAPSLSLEPLTAKLSLQGWWPAPEYISQEASALLFRRDRAELWLSQTAFNDYLHRADVALAMAGTATEQFVGLGKPAITFPGQGPQFTPAFAIAQSHLLGISVVRIDRPAQVVPVLQQILSNPDLLHQIALNGRLRMGLPGAAQRIAQHIQKEKSRWVPPVNP